MTAHQYAIGYPANLVRDSSWACVADVIASYAGGYYCTDSGQVTGTLLRAVVGSDEWVEL